MKNPKNKSLLKSNSSTKKFKEKHNKIVNNNDYNQINYSQAIFYGKDNNFNNFKQHNSNKSKKILDSNFLNHKRLHTKEKMNSIESNLYSNKNSLQQTKMSKFTEMGLNQNRENIFAAIRNVQINTFTEKYSLKSKKSLKPTNTFNLNELELNEATNTNINFQEILKISSKELILIFTGCIIIFSIVVYKKSTIDNNLISINEIVEFIVKEKYTIIKILFGVFVLLFLYYMIIYLKERKSCEHVSLTLAKQIYDFIESYLQSKFMKNTQIHLREDILIEVVVKAFDLDLKRFKNEVYEKFTKPALIKNSNFSLKELIDNGEAKIFWVYNEESIV